MRERDWEWDIHIRRKSIIWERFTPKREKEMSLGRNLLTIYCIDMYIQEDVVSARCRSNYFITFFTRMHNFNREKKFPIKESALNLLRLCFTCCGNVSGWDSMIVMCKKPRVRQLFFRRTSKVLLMHGIEGWVGGYYTIVQTYAIRWSRTSSDHPDLWKMPPKSCDARWDLRWTSTGTWPSCRIRSACKRFDKGTAVMV